MDKVFLTRIILSFFIAGGWITFSTLFAERSGSRIGGLVANLPSNILVSLIFITIINDVDYLKNVIPGIPVGLCIDTIFLVTFILLLKYKLIVAIPVSLVVWFGLAIIMQRAAMDNIYINIFIYLISTVLALLIIEKKVVRMEKIVQKKPTLNQILFRIGFGGIIVASIVTMSKFVNPYFTGIFSTFPAMLLSTLIILSMNQGKEFARATGKMLVLSLTNILIYAIAVSITYPKIGILAGTLVSYLFSVIWVVMLSPVSRRMR